MSRRSFCNRVLSLVERTSIRTLAGWGITVLWLVAVAWMLLPDLDKFLEMELNGKGDFIAGAAAPLAFLWLVIGYFQQGEELQQNTRALTLQGRELALQVIELRKSVAAQDRLAAAADGDAALKKAELADRRAAEKRALQPSFFFRCTGMNKPGPNHTKIFYSVRNSGAAVTNLGIEFVAGSVNEVSMPVAIGTLAANADMQFSFTIDRAHGTPPRMRIHYWDAAADREWQEFQIVLSHHGVPAVLPVGKSYATKSLSSE